MIPADNTRERAKLDTTATLLIELLNAYGNTVTLVTKQSRRISQTKSGSRRARPGQADSSPTCERSSRGAGLFGCKRSP
jgi:hypothetical protein